MNMLIITSMLSLSVFTTNAQEASVASSYIEPDVLKNNGVCVDAMCSGATSMGDRHIMYDANELHDDEYDLPVPSADVGSAPSFYDEMDEDDMELNKDHTPYDGMDVSLDPNLQPMTGEYKNVMAYIPPDISTFYQKPEGTMKELKPSFKGQGGKFINMSPDQVTLYWIGHDDNTVLLSDFKPWASGGTSTFPGHEFVMTKYRRPNDVLCRWKMVPDVSIYYCDHFASPKDAIGPEEARGTIYRQSSRFSSSFALNFLSARDRQSYRAHRRNLQFNEAYKQKTGGVEWISMYPRPPPQHPIWPAEYLGQTHTVETTETHFIESPPPETIGHHLTLGDMRRTWNSTVTVDDGRSSLPLAQYRQPGSLTLNIKAVSSAPKAFEIEGFLSDVEVDHLIHVVERLNLQRSTTNGHESTTRTSRNTWLPRNTDSIINSIFIRAADALRLDEKELRRRLPWEAFSSKDDLGQHNEELQVVHYDRTQEYTAHHDFSYPGKAIYKDGRAPSSRSINFCLYLNDVPSGGQTKFPRWRSAETTEGVAVQPVKGKALIFYMVLPDGNLDDLTQHAALPVLEGYKLFTNLWIWDPSRNDW